MSPFRGRRPALVTGLVALMALFGAVGAVRAAETIGVDPGPDYKFSKQQFTSNEGDVPLFDASGNDDPHNVTSKERGPDGGKLFRSRTIDSGTTPVEGAQYLTAGSYEFECTIHFGMEATLFVGTDGDPKARPRVIATVPSQSLARVRRTGRLKVSLRSPTGAKDIRLTAKGAGRTLARDRGLALAKGVTRTVRLPLTRRGRTALASRKSVVVALRTAVPFARATTSSRTLRNG